MVCLETPRTRPGLRKIRMETRKRGTKVEMKNRGGKDGWQRRCSAALLSEKTKQVSPFSQTEHQQPVALAVGHDDMMPPWLSSSRPGPSSKVRFSGGPIALLPAVLEFGRGRLQRLGLSYGRVIGRACALVLVNQVWQQALAGSAMSTVTAKCILAEWLTDVDELRDVVHRLVSASRVSRLPPWCRWRRCSR